MCIFQTVCILLGIVVALLCLTFLLLRHKSSLIFGIYPTKNLFYHLKYAIALQLLKYLRNRIYKNGALAEISAEKLDKPQTLSDDPKSYDVISFMAANEEGQKLMLSLERRRRGVIKACLYLWLPEYGLLCLPKLPDMLHFSTEDGQENDKFAGCGFNIYPSEYMRLWHLSYEGALRQIKDDKLINVKLQLQFESKLSHFNYNRDLSAAVIADAVARESWNDNFYQLLKNVDNILERRMHYEQNGCLQGVLQLPDNKLVQLKMKGFRDHSFGTERCLSNVNRYVYFALFLADGTNMIVGNLSQPSFFLSSLKVGYVCTPQGAYKPITHCNFELYTYGEKGMPPKHQNFIVHTAECKYFVQITMEDLAVRYLGGDWESKVYNQFVSCTVNGIKGQGITEYLYRNKTGRPEAVRAQDPAWYQRVCKFERSLSNGEHLDADDEVFIF